MKQVYTMSRSDKDTVMNINERNKIQNYQSFSHFSSYLQELSQQEESY